MQDLEAVAITVLSSFCNTHLRDSRDRHCHTDCEKHLTCRDTFEFGGCYKPEQRCFGKTTCFGTLPSSLTTSSDASHTLPLTSRHAIYNREDKSLSFPRRLQSSPSNKAPYHIGYQPPNGLWYCRFCMRNAYKCRDSLRKHCRLHHTDVWTSTECFWQYTEDDINTDTYVTTK